MWCYGRNAGLQWRPGIHFLAVEAIFNEVNTDSAVVASGSAIALATGSHRPPAKRLEDGRKANSIRGFGNRITAEATQS